MSELDLTTCSGTEKPPHSAESPTLHIFQLSCFKIEEPVGSIAGLVDRKAISASVFVLDLSDVSCFY